MTSSSESNDTFSLQWVNLAEERLGTKVLFSTDDFFAEKENLIRPGRGIYIPDKYTERGKWMDGWESRRKRVPGHDYSDIKLGLRGKIKGLDIDTNHFLGNHPPFASVEACDQNNIDEKTKWTEILPRTPLLAGSQNLFEIDSHDSWTHVRLHIYPDGGVARFKVYGEVSVDWSQRPKDQLYDLVAVQNQGMAIECSDMFFSNMNNLVMPGRGLNMGDGWETKRRRSETFGGPLGNDWVILKLGHQGVIKKVEIDTAHFKGNFPESASLEGTIDPNGKAEWKPLLPQLKLKGDGQHFFEKEILDIGTITHVRMNIFPDGGIGRLRLWGFPR
ncbi:allantoicase [Bacteriovoracales bacterium]|nr:allantoicase [Bacteriovoracales bacterium]